MKRDVLISIQPRYVDRILKGQKRYEFRTRVPYTGKARYVYIYCSAPVQKIVAMFPLTEVLEGNPNTIWRLCKDYGGVEKKDFFDYFAGRETAYAIAIKRLHKLDPPIDPYRKIRWFTPPQSFQYLNEFKVLEGARG